MYDILSVNLNETMQYLDSISKEDISYVCSTFDDLSEHFQSKELIECMEKNAKRTGFDCSVDIECAIEMLKKLKYSKIYKIIVQKYSKIDKIIVQKYSKIYKIIVQKCFKNIKIAIKKYSFFKKI